MGGVSWVFLLCYGVQGVIVINSELGKKVRVID